MEYAEITDKQLGDFFEYMDKFPQQGEGQLVRLLKEVSYPADMSQLLVCVNMAGQEKRDGIARSTACMNIFMSWTQVGCRVTPSSFQLLTSCTAVELLQAERLMNGTNPKRTTVLQSCGGS